MAAHCIGAPCNFWQARQWQILASSGSASTSYRTAPQWHRARYFGMKSRFLTDAYSGPNSIVITIPIGSGFRTRIGQGGHTYLEGNKPVNTKPSPNQQNRFFESFPKYFFAANRVPPDQTGGAPSTYPQNVVSIGWETTAAPPCPEQNPENRCLIQHSAHFRPYCRMCLFSIRLKMLERLIGFFIFFGHASKP